jgi:RNA polymerase sigma-54 factor
VDLTLQLGQEQQLRVSPTLIVLNQLLALSSQELQQLVQQELAQNPALELVEGHPCPTCGTPSVGPLCPFCEQPTAPQTTPAPTPKDTVAADQIGDDYYENFGDNRHTAGRQDDDNGDFDPMTLVASQPGRFDALLSDVATMLPPGDRLIAAYLIGSLDERGYLSCPLEDVAAACGVALERVAAVLAVLQHVAPTGVGARNLRECLLLQLTEIKQRGTPPLVPFVEEIITDYLAELGEHKFTMIAHTLGTSYESVAHVRDFIKTHLSPYPAQDGGSRPWNGPSPVRFVAPDVIIRARGGAFEVEVVESLRFSLRINPLYHRLSAAAALHPQGRVPPPNGNGTNGAHGANGTRGADDPPPFLSSTEPYAPHHLQDAMSDGDKDHIRRYVSRSKLFISNIAQRRETIRRITTCLVSIQDDFLRNGIRHLQPLTRAQVAQYLGLHESTVSRATADKYVMLPNRQVIPFSDFFQASLSAKDMIKELITTEPRPLTDKEIVQRLRDQGVRIARRTVTKYRNQLGILPSTFR